MKGAERDFVDPVVLRGDSLAGGKVVVIDVRVPEEFARGHVEEAVNLPLDRLALDTTMLAPGDEIVTVCAPDGKRSCTAIEALTDLDFASVRPLHVGYAGWREAGLDFSKPVKTKVSGL